MLYFEARLSQLRESALEDAFVAKTQRPVEPRARIHHGPSSKAELRKHVALAETCHRFQEMCGGGVEKFEIPRVINDPGRVAVAPVDPDRANVHLHRLSPSCEPRFIPAAASRQRAPINLARACADTMIATPSTRISGLSAWTPIPFIGRVMSFPYIWRDGPP